jgi:hypothetical protein
MPEPSGLGTESRHPKSLASENRLGTFFAQVLCCDMSTETTAITNKKTSTPQSATDERAEQLLWDCLKEIPFVQILKVEQRIIVDPGKPEILARIKVGERERVILAEVKPNGQVRLVREAIGEILKYRETYADAYGLVIAPNITPQAARICRQEGIGYLDFSGNGYLNFDFVFISKTGRELPAWKKTRCRSWYSPRAERVTRVLLMHPQRVWKLRELANEAHVTPGQALSVKRHLVRGQFIEDLKQGFQVSRPALLLDDWGQNYALARSTERTFSSSRSVVEIEAALAGVCQDQIIPYALMGFSAAMRYDPMLHCERVSAYVLSDLSKVVSALELSEAPDKGNVSLWIPYDEGVLRGAEQFDHAKVATPVQTYLDLMQLDEDGEKAANRLWENFMKSNWENVPVAA